MSELAAAALYGFLNILLGGAGLLEA